MSAGVSYGKQGAPIPQGTGSSSQSSQRWADAAPMESTKAMSEARTAEASLTAYFMIATSRVLSEKCLSGEALIGSKFLAWRLGRGEVHPRVTRPPPRPRTRSAVRDARGALDRARVLW